MAKSFCATHILELNILHLFNTALLLFITHILPYSLNIYRTYVIPIGLANTDSNLHSHDPNTTNLKVSHYDCKKQHNLRQFNSVNVKGCTEAPSNVQDANVIARVYVRVQLNQLKHSSVKTLRKKEERYVLKVQLNTDVLTELYEGISQCHFLLHLNF